jgi:hypothetical protein
MISILDPSEGSHGETEVKTHYLSDYRYRLHWNPLDVHDWQPGWMTTKAKKG